MYGVIMLGTMFLLPTTKMKSLPMHSPSNILLLFPRKRKRSIMQSLHVTGA